MEKACASELTENEASGFHGSSHDVKKVEGTFPECFRCGKTNHSSKKCFHRKAQCHECQKFGHIVLKCPKKRVPKAKEGESKKSGKNRKRKPGGVHSVEETVTIAEPEGKTAWPMFTVVDSQRRCKELIMLVLTDGKSVDLKLDAGASVTIIPNHVWSGVLAAKSLQQTDVKRKSNSGHEIPVLGEANVQVSYGNQHACLPVIVTAGDGPALMGRNWLSVFRLDWKQIKQISLEPCDQVEKLVSKYASLFNGDLGTIKGVTAHLKLKENAILQFFKPRPVPFALKEKIAEELKRLERIGVLEKVGLIGLRLVPVLKPDGTVRI